MCAVSVVTVCVCSEWRNEEDIEDLYNILEGFAMQVSLCPMQS